MNKLTGDEPKHFGCTHRVSLTDDAAEITKVIVNQFPAEAGKLVGIKFLEIRDSGFQACDHDWEEFRFYDEDRTLRHVFVKQRKDPRNIIN